MPRCWRNPEGANSLGHLSASLLSHGLSTGMLLRPSTDICPQELARDMRGFFNSLLGCGNCQPRKKGPRPDDSRIGGPIEFPHFSTNSISTPLGSRISIILQASLLT
jgi:hypothetical protein